MFDLQREIADFLETLEAEVPAIAREARMRTRFGGPAAEADTDLADAAERATYAAIELALVAMRSPAAAPRAAPDALARLAVVGVQRDVTLGAVHGALRTVHAVLLDALLARAERDGTSLEAVEIVSRHLFWFVDSMVPLVTEAYASEERRAGTRPDGGRTARIRAVLEGEGRPELGYPLAAAHVAVVLHGPQSRACLRALLDDVRVPVLATEASDHTVWAWLACELCEDDVVRILRRAWQGGCVVGVSGHERGVEGFRATHRKARLALRLGRRRGSPVTTFADVALEALAFGGEEMAREFVRAEMGRLLDDSPRTRVIRETLAAYFAQGSAANAARDLGVSERAVVYRLRHAEQLLGRPLTVRRAELETALRLHGMFVTRVASLAA